MNLKSGFESLQSISQVLNSENQKLLKIIPEQKPESLKEPETATGVRGRDTGMTSQD